MVDKETNSKEEFNDEWTQLYLEVKDAIKKHDASHIDFVSKNIYQCKFQQKCVEVEKSDYPILWSAIIFLLAMGASGVSRYNSNDLVSLPPVIMGLSMFAIAFFLIHNVWKPEHYTCKEIVIKSEKQIQKLSNEEHNKEKRNYVRT